MIYIPQKIKVGYQNRSDTYSGKLAYIIYYDEKGKLRKEASWQNWRSKDIEPEEFDNEPIFGFVLNKKVGGIAYHYDVRQTYVRVYDPRGFEFEITIPNLIFILENTSSIKGKGLEGEFVYGWDGKELVLIPTSSPDYEELMNKAQQLESGTYYIPSSDIKIGYKYKDKRGNVLTYMGKFDAYSWSGEKYASKQHFFCSRSVSPYNNSPYYCLNTWASLKNKFVAPDHGNEGPDEHFAELVEYMEGRLEYSPIDESSTRYIPLAYEEFEDRISKDHFSHAVFRTKPSICRETIYYDTSTNPTTYYIQNSNWYYCKKREFSTTSIKELYDYLKPAKKQTFLKNGRLYREEYR